MKTLLSDQLWTELSRIAETHTRIRAAISYVTAEHLRLAEGDELVCDASEDAITAGMTSASTLRAFFSRGARLYSYDGLHAKVAVIDDLALIGSANLSENAGVHTCEAALLTDDPQVVGLIHGFIEQVRDLAVSVDDAFLRSIESLPVSRRAPRTPRAIRRVVVGTSRLWFVATRDLSERVALAEAASDQAGAEEARKHRRNEGYEVRSIRWAGRSSFRSEAKPGDLVIETSTTADDDGKVVEVYQAAPILHKQEGDRWTRFYLEVPAERICYEWSEVQELLETLGVTRMTSNSTRELTGRAVSILQLME